MTSVVPESDNFVQVEYSERSHAPNFSLSPWASAITRALRSSSARMTKPKNFPYQGYQRLSFSERSPLGRKMKEAFPYLLQKRFY